MSARLGCDAERDHTTDVRQELVAVLQFDERRIADRPNETAGGDVESRGHGLGLGALAPVAAVRRTPKQRFD